MSRLLRVSFALMMLLALGSHAEEARAESRLAQIEQRGKLILGTSGNMPSMSEVDANGKLGGFDIDMARLMANSMGVELVAEVMPFNELIPALESGKVDVVISNLTITSKRNMRVAFVGPYITSGKCFVTKSEALARAEGSQDLNTPETRLAVLKNTTSEDFARELFPQATIVAVDSYEDAAVLVKNDKASGLLTDYPICMATLKNHPDAGFVTLFSLLTYEPIGIALPANDSLFINWTENFLQRLDGTDTLKGLSDRWFGRITLSKSKAEPKAE